MPFQQHLDCERRAKVRIVLPDQRHHILLNARSQSIACRLTSGLVDQGSTATNAILASKRCACRKLTPSTPAADSVVRMPASTSLKTSTRCKSRLLICTQPNLRLTILVRGSPGDTLALKSYDIIALRLHGRVGAH